MKFKTYLLSLASLLSIGLALTSAHAMDPDRSEEKKAIQKQQKEIEQEKKLLDRVQKVKEQQGVNQIKKALKAQRVNKDAEQIFPENFIKEHETFSNDQLKKLMNTILEVICTQDGTYSRTMVRLNEYWYYQSKSLSKADQLGKKPEFKLLSFTKVEKSSPSCLKWKYELKNTLASKTYGYSIYLYSTDDVLNLKPKEMQDFFAKRKAAQHFLKLRPGTHDSVGADRIMTMFEKAKPDVFSSPYSQQAASSSSSPTDSTQSSATASSSSFRSEIGRGNSVAKFVSEQVLQRTASFTSKKPNGIALRRAEWMLISDDVKKTSKAEIKAEAGIRTEALAALRKKCAAEEKAEKSRKVAAAAKAALQCKEYKECAAGEALISLMSKSPLGEKILKELGIAIELSSKKEERFFPPSTTSSSKWQKIESLLEDGEDSR